MWLRAVRRCQWIGEFRYATLRVEQSGKELAADLGEHGDQPFIERIDGTRYYG
jgi:hypothetical protein